MGVVPGLGKVGVDIVEDLDLESLQDLQPPSLLTHQVQCAEGERNPDIPGKDLLLWILEGFLSSQKRYLTWKAF